MGIFGSNFSNNFTQGDFPIIAEIFNLLRKTLTFKDKGPKTLSQRD